MVRVHEDRGGHMGSHAGVTDGQGPLGILDLKVGPVSGLFSLEGLPDLGVPVYFGPAIPDVQGDLKSLHDPGRTDGMHAADEAAGEIGGQFARFSRVGIGVIAVPGLHVSPARIHKA